MRAPSRTPRHVVALAMAFGLLPSPASAVRLKELVEVDGFRSNALTGIGLVVGLNGTGDDASSLVTKRPLAALLRHLGTVVDPSEIKAKNVALVTVTSNLPPFAHAGMTIDVTVSSMGTAKSLQGGTLIAVQMKGADRRTYAIAQGPLMLGGFAADGGTGSSVRKNHVTVARIPGGATVERDAPAAMPTDEVRLVLREPDFTTASRVAEAVNASLGADTAKVTDPAVVRVGVPETFRGKVVELVAALERVEATPDARARVVIDERTGTIVVGAGVSLSPAAIASGGLTVQVNEKPEVSQPGPLGSGKTVVNPSTQIDVGEGSARLVTTPAAGTVADVASALNALGVKPRDLIAIFQALKVAGALQAELVVL